MTLEVGWNFLLWVARLWTTMKLDYNENSGITNRFLSKIGHTSTQINPVITNKMSGPELSVITEFDCISNVDSFIEIESCQWSKLKRVSFTLIGCKCLSENVYLASRLVWWQHVGSYSAINWQLVSFLIFAFNKMQQG